MAKLWSFLRLPVNQAPLVKNIKSSDWKIFTGKPWVFAIQKKGFTVNLPINQWSKEQQKSFFQSIPKHHDISTSEATLSSTVCWPTGPGADGMARSWMDLWWDGMGWDWRFMGCDVKKLYTVYMYVCMHACMHVCMCACMYACMHVCMCACRHVGMYVCTYVRM